MKGFDIAQAEYDAMTPIEYDYWECEFCEAGEGDDHNKTCPYYDAYSPEAEEPDYCPDCMGVGSCSCDSQYESFKERERWI